MCIGDRRCAAISYNAGLNPLLGQTDKLTDTKNSLVAFSSCSLHLRPHDISEHLSFLFFNKHSRQPPELLFQWVIPNFRKISCSAPCRNFVYYSLDFFGDEEQQIRAKNLDFLNA